MTEYIVESRDFTDGENCIFCNRPLPTGRATFVLQLSTAKRFPSGPSCAKKYAQSSEYQVPDYTGISKFKLDKANSKRKSERKAKSTSGKLGFPQEIKYLILRATRLSGFKNAKLSFIDDYYKNYLNNSTLSDKEINHLKNLMSKAEVEMPLLSMSNLQACYTYDYWLNRIINKLPRDDSGFFVGLLEQLHERFFLSIKQIEAINNWTAKRNHYPQLDPGVFKLAVSTDAKLHPYRYKPKNK